MNFWHVTHPVGSGGSATELSVTDDPPGRGGDAMRVRPIASKVSLFVLTRLPSPRPQAAAEALC